jgi:hypothetical protein
MRHERTEANQSETTNNLRSVFDASVEALVDPQSSAAKLKARVPIVQRRTPTSSIDEASRNKRALADAAAALAALWNVPEPFAEPRRNQKHAAAPPFSNQASNPSSQGPSSR